MVLTVLLSLLPGCTSLQWRDADGVDHHLGVFAYRRQDLASGRRLVRISAGFDLRLSGEERGASLGFKRTEITEPRTIEVDDADRLADLVAAHVAGSRPATPPATPAAWGFFYLAERVTSRATLLDTTSIGVDLVGRAPGRLTVGYARYFSLIGRALDDDIVQVHTVARDREELSLWVLRPAATSNP